ncbi:MAG: rRNA pseudouridine synthase [Butyrivibrio sp.]|uniref:pseudouridine synthase n=1 Tax=Butyrivibrio sp. TaxID=28121 RepID=UPI001B159D44|nr:pseudouridine synthase [Butyrivibrio sp.]MBO6242532.1 rRNA pseudouridine synthase [Butyrivibrio sp.]
MRLNKFIAGCGVCSRREADKLIEEGRVSINGEIAGFGALVLDGDTVLVDGKEISLQEEKIVIAYYKPVGVTCTEKDKFAQKTVIEDLGFEKRVTYAGRLDKESEGLLLMTNDGDLINAMMRGASGHEKEYEVTVDKEVTADFIRAMSGGIYLKELDKKTRPCKVKKTGKYSFDIVLTQGLNRQIRRMCDALGFSVKKLKRIRVMSVRLEDYNLKPGEHIVLTKEEVKKLCKDAGL